MFRSGPTSLVPCIVANVVSIRWLMFCRLACMCLLGFPTLLGQLAVQGADSLLVRLFGMGRYATHVSARQASKVPGSVMIMAW